MPTKPLIVMALEQEGRGLIEPLGFEVLYCGVGKVNASYHLTRRLALAEARGEPIAWVLNLGSAGSHRHGHGSLIGADRFVQHDMDARGIGFALGETPFDPLSMITVPRRFDSLTHGICASGDAFVEAALELPCDMVDMEAYALAKVAHRSNVPFSCVKYITDGGDEAASGDWHTNLIHAAEAFRGLLKASV